MKRASFVRAIVAAPFLAFGARTGARSQSDEDPAMTAPSASLRVLLGRGTATPLGPGQFEFGGRSYRGSFRVTSDGSVVNLVDLEQYLYSVVPGEMPPGWPSAALQAQAICARTYVLKRSAPQREYDLVPSQLDQVYGGIEAESPSCSEAVDATARRILQFGGQDAEALYSSCCGGRTEASSDVWGGAQLPYLMGVVCPYCVDSPNYRWRRDVALISIAQAFQAELSPLGELTNVRIATTDASGRVESVALDTGSGSAFVKGSAFRISVGARVVPSLLITKMDAMLAITGSAPGPALALEGRGLGHGVGLCQWGARGMALLGRSAADILELYFPGTEPADD